MPRPLFATLSLLALTGVLSACVVIQPPGRSRSLAPDARPASSPPAPATGLVTGKTAAASPNPAVEHDIWPDRWGSNGRVRGVVVEASAPQPQLRSAHLGRFHQLRTGEREYTQAAQLAKALGITEPYRFEPEGPGSLVFMPPVRAPDEAPAPTVDDPSETFVFVSAQVEDRVQGEDRVRLERTWFAWYDASLNTDNRGTIVLLPGMLGTPKPIIEAMIRYWRRSGFAVLRMLSHPARFTEHLERKLDPSEAERVGRELAPVFDQRTAECAYAVDAALDHVESIRPPVKDRPVVLVGMSGGAIVLPTVYSYAPERYQAAVLIAGGVDFLRISAQSNYAEWIDALTLDWAPEDPESLGDPTPADYESLSDGYLATSRLDAAHTATNLIELPTLVLHAARDKAVPAGTGDRLWAALGSPERWTYPMGHEMIFIALPTQAGRLDTWLRDTLQSEGQADEEHGG